MVIDSHRSFPNRKWVASSFFFKRRRRRESCFYVSEVSPIMFGIVVRQHEERASVQRERAED